MPTYKDPTRPFKDRLALQAQFLKSIGIDPNEMPTTFSKQDILESVPMPYVPEFRFKPFVAQDFNDFNRVLGISESDDIGKQMLDLVESGQFSMADPRSKDAMATSLKNLGVPDAEIPTYLQVASDYANMAARMSPEERQQKVAEERSRLTSERKDWENRTAADRQRYDSDALTAYLEYQDRRMKTMGEYDAERQKVLAQRVAKDPLGGAEGDLSAPYMVFDATPEEQLTSARTRVRGMAPTDAQGDKLASLITPADIIKIRESRGPNPRQKALMDRLSRGLGILDG